MAALVIKNLPQRLHHLLKEDAARNRRSMIQHAIYLLESALEPAAAPPAMDPPVPIDLGAHHDEKWIYRSIRAGRS
jgi:plasmid stability protein